MNAEVNPAIMLALKKQVERAVRPVRAGKNRKLVMREELLAHLTALYIEERMRHANDPPALAAALARFGEPAALTAELNDSIGWKETMDFHEERIARRMDQWFSFHEAEPFWRFAARSSVVGIAVAMLMLLSVVVIRALNLSQRDDPTQLPLLVKLLAFVALSAWGFLLAVQVTHRALYKRHQRPRWLAAIGQGAAWSALFVALSAAFWWSITLDAGSVLDRLPLMATYAFGMIPPILLLIAWLARADEKRQQPHREWQQLEIDQ